MKDKQVNFRLSAEDYERLSSQANRVDLSVSNYVKNKILNSLDSHVEKDDDINILLSHLVDISLDTHKKTETVKLMLKIVMQQTWTLLQSVAASSDEEGRKELKRLHALSKERIEENIKKITDE